MPKRSTPFQRLVFMLKHALAAENVKVQESVEFADNITGEKREVDIILEVTVAGDPVKIAIEVVEWQRPAGVPWVEAMVKKHESLPTDKLILISKSGFTKPARAKAAYYHVDILTHLQAEAADWEAATELLAGGSFELTEMDFSCSALLGNSGSFAPISLATLVYLPYREEPTDIEAMARHFMANRQIGDVLHANMIPNSEKTFTLEYTPENGTMVSEGLPLGKLRIVLRVRKTLTPMGFCIGRIQEHSYIQGIPEDQNATVTVALFRSADGEINGRMVTKEGVRLLHGVENPKDRQWAD